MEQSLFSGLNQFSREVAVELFHQFPWLEQHAEVEGESANGNGLLVIKYSPLPIREHCELWIATENDEVTVGFGIFHMHFPWPKEEDDPYWEDPVDFLRGLFEDRILIEDWTKSGKWTGSTVLVDGASPDLSGMEAEHEVFIRSWSGKLDQRHTLAEGSTE